MHQRALAKMTPQIIIIKAPTWRGNTLREVKNVMLHSDIIGLVIHCKLCMLRNYQEAWFNPL